MHTEYEVRVLEIDSTSIFSKLEEIGAELEWDLLQRRYVYDFIPKVNGKWIRLRTNGDKTTLTIKNLVSSEIDGTQELEIRVDDFDKTNFILNELGYEARSYQENRRVQYKYEDVEIDVDSWPGIPTFLEIEGPSEEKVYEILFKIGFKKDDCTTLDIDSIYKKYGIELDSIKKLKFEEEIK